MMDRNREKPWRIKEGQPQPDEVGSVLRDSDAETNEAEYKRLDEEEKLRQKVFDQISSPWRGTILRLSEPTDPERVELKEAYPYPRPEEKSEYQEVYFQQWDNTCTFASFINIINSFGRLPETDLNNLEAVFKVTAGDQLKKDTGITWDNFKNFISKTGYKTETIKNRADWFENLKDGGGAIVLTVTENGNYHAKAVIVYDGKLLLVDPLPAISKNRHGIEELDDEGELKLKPPVEEFDLTRVGLDQLLARLGVAPEDKKWITENVLVFNSERNHRKESAVKPTDWVTKYEKIINDYVSGGTDIRGEPLRSPAERKKSGINLNKEYKLAQQTLTAEEKEQIKAELKEYYDRYHYLKSNELYKGYLKIGTANEVGYTMNKQLDKAFKIDLKKAIISYAYLKKALTTPEKITEKDKDGNTTTILVTPEKVMAEQEYLDSQLEHYKGLELKKDYVRGQKQVDSFTEVTRAGNLYPGQQAELRMDFDKKNPIHSPYLKWLRTKHAIGEFTNAEQDYLIKHGDLKMGVERPVEKPEPSVSGSWGYDQEGEWVAGADDEFVGAKRKKNDIERTTRNTRDSLRVVDSGALHQQMDKLSDQQKISELKHQLDALFSGGQKENKTTKPIKKIEESHIEPETLPGAEQIVLPSDQELVEFLGKKLDKYDGLYEQGDKKAEQHAEKIVVEESKETALQSKPARTELKQFDREDYHNLEIIKQILQEYSLITPELVGTLTEDQIARILEAGSAGWDKNQHMANVEAVKKALQLEI